jgi:large subunit ribosomal protein L16
MLHPKNTKYIKIFRGRISGNDTKVIELSFGNIGIKVLKNARITTFQLESLRKALVKKIKGRGKIWFRVFPSVPVTSKPAEVRMGKGKGDTNYWCSQVNAGRILVELQGIPFSLNKEIIKISKHKLPVPIKFIFL